MWDWGGMGWVILEFWFWPENGSGGEYVCVKERTAVSLATERTVSHGEGALLGRVGVSLRVVSILRHKLTLKRKITIIVPITNFHIFSRN